MPNTGPIEGSRRQAIERCPRLCSASVRPTVVVVLPSPGGVGNGYPREDGLDIVVASELMAIFCLTESWADLKQRIGDIVIGYTRGTKPVTAQWPACASRRWDRCSA